MTDDQFSPQQLAFFKWMELNELSFRDISERTGVPYSSLKSFATRPGQTMNGRNAQKLIGSYNLPFEDIFVDPHPIHEKRDPHGAWRKFFAAKHESAETADNENNRLPHSEPTDGMVSIPEYDIKVSAGGGSDVHAEEIKNNWLMPKRFITDELRVNPTSLNMVEVKGDSMAPKLMPGDRILIDQNDTNPTPPGIFALWDGYGLVVKNVQRVHKSEPAQLRLISENPLYGESQVFVDDVKIVGRVVWCARKL